MRRTQLGIGLGGLLVGAVIVIAVLLLVMKLAPSYIEFFAIKKAVNAIASEKGAGATAVEIRKSFDNHATIDDISTVKGSDLEITKDASGVSIRAAYRKEIPLFANVGIYINFEAASK
jgi:hypothetical protein